MRLFSHCERSSDGPVFATDQTEIDARAAYRRSRRAGSVSPRGDFRGEGGLWPRQWDSPHVDRIGQVEEFGCWKRGACGPTPGTGGEHENRAAPCDFRDSWTLQYASHREVQSPSARRDGPRNGGDVRRIVGTANGIPPLSPIIPPQLFDLVRYSAIRRKTGKRPQTENAPQTAACGR